MAYSDEQKEMIFNSICTDVIENKLSFNAAIDKAEITRTSFYNWLKDNKDFDKLYNYAREIRSDIIFEEILEISDDSKNDVRLNEEGKEIANNELVNRSRLRVDARKWVLAKMNPKKYGDKVDVTSDYKQIQGITGIQIVRVNGSTESGEEL